MPRPVPMIRAWLLAGALAAVLSGAVLALWSVARGQVAWLPFNATSHGLHGPAAADTNALDLAHTGLGLAIHVGAGFFWAAVAVLLLRRSRRDRAGLAWAAGLGTAALAGVVDYGLLPARLTPGWELVLPPVAVFCGLLALGVGIALGLAAAREGNVPQAVPAPVAADPAVPAPEPEGSTDRLRHPAPGVLDQRQQRIDPAQEVTDDPNRHGLPARDPAPSRKVP